MRTTLLLLLAQLPFATACNFAVGARCTGDDTCPDAAPVCVNIDADGIGTCAESGADAGAPPVDGGQGEDSGPPPVDGGPDAGTPDLDSGPDDAGPDDSGADDGGLVDGGSDDDAGVPGPCEPGVTVDPGFPAFGSFNFPIHAVTTFEDSILIRARAGDDNPLCGVLVNGEAPEVSGSSEYVARVPLVLGANQLTLTIEEAGFGSRQILGPIVTRVGYVPVVADGAAFITGPTGGQMMVSVDNYDSVVFGIDEDNAYHYLSGELRGASAPPLSAPHFVAATAGATTFYVSNSAELFAIDALTGDRTHVVTEPAATGAGMNNVRAIAINDGTTLYALKDPGKIFTVSLETASVGDIALVSSSDPTAEVGTGPLIPNDISGMTFLFGKLYVVKDDAPPTIWAIDPATGNRTIVLDAVTGTGPEPTGGGPLGVLDNDRLLLATRDGELYAIHRETGSRALLSGPASGTGPLWSRPSGVALMNAGEAWVVDREAQQVMRVDLATGDRTRVGVDIGSGPRLLHPRGIDVAPGGNALVVVDESSRVFTIPFESGDRAVLSSDAIHTSDPYSYGDLWDVAATSDNRIVITDDTHKAVWYYRMDSMTRAPFSAGDNSGGLDAQEATGEGANFTSLRSIAVRDDGEVYVSNPADKVVYRVEINTHDRTAFTFPSLTNFTPSGLSGDASSDALFVADSETWRVFRATDTGTSLTFTGDGVGGGEDFFSAPIDLDVPDDLSVIVVTSTGWLFSVNRANGERKLIGDFGNFSGRGPTLQGPQGLAVDGNHAYLTSYARNAIMVADVVTGERAFLTH